jgi:serine/threonine-protein kinase RsbW
VAQAEAQAAPAEQRVITALDLPAGIEYLHVPGACLGALFEGDQDLSARPDLAYGLQLALYEICANIVTHGYGISEESPCGDGPPGADGGGNGYGRAGASVAGANVAGANVAGTEAQLRRIRVVFTVAQQPVRLEIDLYDTGCSFDIAQVPEPNVAEPQDRGYGLYLIRKLADEVVYEVKEAAGDERPVAENNVRANGIPGSGALRSANHWRLTKYLERLGDQAPGDQVGS